MYGLFLVTRASGIHCHYLPELELDNFRDRNCSKSIPLRIFRWQLIVKWSCWYRKGRSFDEKIRADNFLDRKYYGAYTSLLEKCLCRLSHPMKFYAKILHRKIFPPSPWSLINLVPNPPHHRHAVEFYEKIFRRKIFPSRDRWSKIFRRKIFPSRDRWSILYRISFTRGMPWNFTKKYFIEKLFLPMLLLMKFYEKIFEKRLLPVFVVLSRSNRKVKEVSGTIDDAPLNILWKKSFFSHYTPQTMVLFMILVR